MLTRFDCFILFINKEIYMRHFLFYPLVLLFLSGCVTQNTYDGSKKPVITKKIDNTQAARTRISLALKYLSMGDSSQAKYNLEKALDFSPNLPEVHYTTAYFYQSVGEPDKAKQSYERALSISPNDANTLNNYGVFLCDLGEYDHAVDNFLSAIEIPSYLRVAESYENLALCAIDSDDFDNVEEYLKSSVKHSPMRGSSLINLSAFYYAKSDLHKAQMTLKRYGAAGRVSSRSLLLSYLIESSMGHIEQARTLALTIEQTYTTSLEAKILRERKMRASEFEQLKEQYRKSELRKLQKDILSRKDKPKIKIIKKKKAPNTTQVKKTPEKVTQLTRKVQVIPSKPLTAEIKQESSGMESEPVILVEQLKVEVSEPLVELPVAKVPNKSILIEQQLAFKNRSITEIEVPFHIVKNGENLFSISVKYNVKLPSLLHWNKLSESDQVYKGTKIYLNNPNIYHQVNEGDTLFSISVKYNILMKKLLEWNAFEENVYLTPNNKILLVDPKTYIL